MATWPATLPQAQFVGLADLKTSGMLRTQMDIGPAKSRRRFTATVRNVDVPIIVDNDHRETFDSFFDGTIGDGSLPFDWTDPVTDNVVSFRFRNAPSFRLLRGDPGRSKRHHIATLQLEILP